MNKRIKVILFCLGIIGMIACGGNGEKKKESGSSTTSSEATASTEATILDFKSDGSRGVGPVTAIEHKPFDAQLANKGVELFVSKCAMCHNFERTLVGPSLDGVVKRRTPEWIMNMMLDPATMLEKDADAIALSKDFSSPMISLGLQQEEARAILEYLRERNSAAK